MSVATELLHTLLEWVGLQSWPGSHTHSNCPLAITHSSGSQWLKWVWQVSRIRERDKGVVWQFTSSLSKIFMFKLELFERVSLNLNLLYMCSRIWQGNWTALWVNNMNNPKCMMNVCLTKPMHLHKLEVLWCFSQNFLPGRQVVLSSLSVNPGSHPHS